MLVMVTAPRMVILRLLFGLKLIRCFKRRSVELGLNLSIKTRYRIISDCLELKMKEHPMAKIPFAL